VKKSKPRLKRSAIHRPQSGAKSRQLNNGLIAIIIVTYFDVLLEGYNYDL
jgi:hypothetical protein